MFLSLYYFFWVSLFLSRLNYREPPFDISLVHIHSTIHPQSFLHIFSQPDNIPTTFFT
jgi:hypothetical protein